MTEKKKTITNDDLAIMIKNGFDEAQSERKKITDKLEEIDKRLGHVETDVSEIKLDHINREEFEDLSSRVKYVEVKTGIESGK